MPNYQTKKVFVFPIVFIKRNVVDKEARFSPMIEGKMGYFTSVLEVGEVEQYGQVEGELWIENFA